MKSLIVALMIIGAAVFGMHVLIWICFISGIVDIIHCIQTEDLVYRILAIGIVKVLIAGGAGWYSIGILVAIGKFITSIAGGLMEKYDGH